MESLPDPFKIIRVNRDESILHIGIDQRIAHQDLPGIGTVRFLHAQDTEHLHVDEYPFQMVGIRHTERDNACADGIQDILNIGILLLLLKNCIRHIGLNNQDRVMDIIQIIVLKPPVPEFIRLSGIVHTHLIFIKPFFFKMSGDHIIPAAVKIELSVFGNDRSICRKLRDSLMRENGIRITQFFMEFRQNPAA